jgi:hypothetical protein
VSNKKSYIIYLFAENSEKTYKENKKNSLTHPNKSDNYSGGNIMEEGLEGYFHFESSCPNRLFQTALINANGFVWLLSWKKGHIMYERLREHLFTLKSDLKGHWILDYSPYKENLCHILKMRCRKSGYWDAEWGGLFLEFERGRNIRLDLLRYSKAFLKLDPDSSIPALTAFFIPTQRRERIEQIIVVDTRRLLRKLDLTEEIAKGLIALNKRIAGKLNAQAGLTLKDVKEISLWTV